MSELFGVDVSMHQGDINFDVLKNNVDFFICKATEGFGYVDPKFVRNRAEARRVGLPLGFYHFARPDLGNTPEKEAEFFLNTTLDFEDGDMLFLDFEVSYADPVKWCKRFLDFISVNLNGYKALIYLNQSQIKSFDWTPIINADYGLWIAAYLDYCPDTPWTAVAFQQNSSSGAVAGINGKVDTNLFFGDKETLAKYGVTVEDSTGGATGGVEAQIKELKDKVQEYKKQRDEWKKKAKDYKSQVESMEKLQSEIEAILEDKTATIVKLQNALATNITPLDTKDKNGKYVYSSNALLKELIGRLNR